MVALSAVSMNNLESFAVENFAASPLVLSFRRFSRALHSQERTIVVEKKRTREKNAIVFEGARRTGIENGTCKVIFLTQMSLKIHLDEYCVLWYK